jgi:hypothetical protein
MITMQLTPDDIRDAKKVIDAADLDGPQAKMLYDALFLAASQVGQVFDIVPIAIEGKPQRLLRRRKKAIKP